MSDKSLSLSLRLLYNETPTLSYAAFEKNDAMAQSFQIEKVSESANELVIKVGENKATFKKVAAKTDFDYEAYQTQAELFMGQEFFTFRHEAVAETKDHNNYIEVNVETDAEGAFLQIQALFFATMYQTDAQAPVGVHLMENGVLLSFGDFTEFGINQVNAWPMYCAWFNICAAEKNEKVTIYTKGVKKLGEKDLEITVKKKNMDVATKFLLNLTMNSLSTTSSYKDQETTTNILNGKEYEFTKKKSKFLDAKVLELEKW